MSGPAAPSDPARQGESEFTFRAVLGGLAIGGPLTLGNLYMGLKTGWWISGDITAAVLGFAILAPWARRRSLPYSIRENNITQATAATATVMPSALGLLGAIPALTLLGQHLPLWQIGVWGLVLALFGLALGLPLRRRYVVTEPLAFPTAMATAEVIRTVHRSAGDARARLRALLVGAAIAALITWFRDGRPALLPGALWLPFQLVGQPAQVFTLGVGVSPALLSVGVLVGARTGVSLGLGAVIAWGFLAPALVRGGVVRAEYSELVLWLLWPGVSLMATSSLLGLALQWKTFSRAFSAARSEEREGHWLTLWAAPAVLGAAVVILAWALFAVPPLLGVVMLLASVVLIGVIVRSAGETDIAPISQMGQLVQLLAGIFGPGSAAANLASASVVASSGAGSAVSVYAYKTGHLLGASKHGQLYAQLLGAAAGSLVSLPAYALIANAYTVGSQTLPVPGALAWKGLAELSIRGAAALPAGSGLACGIAAAAGLLLTLLDATRWRKFTPAPYGVAAAFFIPATVALAVALGSLVWLGLSRRSKTETMEAMATATAAGGIAGESLMGFGVAVLIALGIFGTG